jgi:hypothetical protein
MAKIPTRAFWRQLGEGVSKFASNEEILVQKYIPQHNKSCLQHLLLYFLFTRNITDLTSHVIAEGNRIWSGTE